MLHDRTATPAAASSESTNAPAAKPPQFSLRTLLAALAVFPLLLALAAWHPEMSLGAVVWVALGLVALGCLRTSNRFAKGGTPWQEFAAGALTFAGSTLVTLWILGFAYAFCTILVEALIPSR